MPETSEPNPSEDGETPHDVKRRFKEALDRKNARAKSGDSHANGSSNPSTHNSGTDEQHRSTPGQLWTDLETRPTRVSAGHP
jgi:hypothetical protein